MADTYAEIGGDRRTLNSNGHDLATAARELGGVTRALNRRVQDLVGDAGWSGDAASSFRTHWEVCSAAGGALTQAMVDISAAMQKLAAVLAEAQSDLDDARDFAEAHRIRIDPDGNVITESLDPHYTQYHTMADNAIKKAKRAREDAERDFAAVVNQLAPHGQTGDALGTSDNVTLADAARALYGIPGAMTAKQREEVKEIDAERVRLKHMAKHLPKQSAEWKTNNRLRLDGRKALREARASLAETEKSLSKWKFSKYTEVTVGQARKVFNKSGGAMAMDGFPLIGGVVGLAGIYMGTKDDVQKGWGVWHSIGVETGATVVSMASGVAVDSVAEAAPIEVPVAATVGGGVLVGYGVGTYGTELFKAGHWAQNIHDHGVLAGIGHSFGDAGGAWWNQDVVGVKDKIVNSAKNVWADVF